MKLNQSAHSRQRKIFRGIGIVMSIIASVIWLSSIVVLLIRWGLDDFNRYDSDDGQVVYISSVCFKFKSGCILGTVVTGISYTLAVLFATLYYNSIVQQRFRRILSRLSIVCAFISSLSLILLSIFDIVKHKAVHYTFLGLFIIFILLSAALYIIYRFKNDQINFVLYIYPSIIGLLIPLIVTFIVMAAIGGKDDRLNLTSVAGSLEWSISVVVALYLVLFAMDLVYFK